MKLTFRIKNEKQVKKLKKKDKDQKFLFLNNKKETKKKKQKGKRTKPEPEKRKWNPDQEIVVGVRRVEQKTSPKETEKKEKQKKKKTKKVQKAPTTTKKKIKKQDKIRNIQQEKRKKRMKSFLKWIILITVVIGLFVFFLFSPIFNIQTRTVENNSIVSSEEIIQLSGIQIGENLFSIPTLKVKNNIKKNAYIEDIEIKRKLPNEIVIQVKERKPTYVLEKEGKYAYINNQGYILEISDHKPNLPVITSYQTTNFETGKRLVVEDLEKMEVVLKIVENAKANGIADLITQIDIKDITDIVLNMEAEGKTIYIGDATDINTKVLLLKKCLEGEKGKSGEIFLDGKINKTNEAVFREKV